MTRLAKRVGRAAGVGAREGAGWAAGVGVLLGIKNARHLVTDATFARGLAELAAFIFAVVALAVAAAVLWRAAPAEAGLFAEGKGSDDDGDGVTPTFAVGAIATVFAGVAALAWVAHAG